jgi:hypothetical protein
MSTTHDLAEAFARLDALLAAAEAAGPAMELLLATGKAQGVTEMRMFRQLQINATIVRWCVKLSPAAVADRDELTDVGELLIEWARRSAS